MKTMLMSVIVTLAIAGQASAAGKFAASEAINKALAPISKGLTVEAVRQLRSDVNDYMGKVDTLKPEEKEAAGAKLKKDLANLVDGNSKVVAALAERFKVGAGEISAFSKAAPELLLVEGWLRTANLEDAATKKIVSEMTTIIQKVSTQIGKADKTQLYAVYKVFALVTTEIGGNYEGFRTELAAQLAKDVALEPALYAAARKVLGEKADDAAIKSFLAELARCKV